MHKEVDAGTTVQLEWWDSPTGCWAIAGEYETRDAAVANMRDLDRQNAAWNPEPTTWRIVTTTTEAI